MQYRLGVHGFLSSLSSTGQTETPGNFGLLDQQAAIEFVHRNAKNLGGDPAKITIGGESAGAWSIGWQMLSPKTTEMIRTAISQSGMATFNMSVQDLESATCLQKTGSETGFLAQNLDRLLDRDFRAEFQTEKQNRFLRWGQNSRQELRQVLKQNRAPCSVQKDCLRSCLKSCLRLKTCSAFLSEIWPLKFLSSNLSRFCT